jgi:phospholipase/carboxylesterase
VGLQRFFFHGYGADMHDLAPLSQMMDPKGQVNWYFPNGILDVLIGPGFYGRAWFPIDLARYERAMKMGRAEDISSSRSPGMDHAIELAAEMLTELQSRHSSVIIGGFSQGAMMATELSFTLKEKPKGVVIMSGVLIDEANWRQKISLNKGMSYLQSHGKSDAILSYEGAKKLNELLNQSGWRGDFVGFSGGHEIPMEVIQRVGSFVLKKSKD